MILNLDMWCVKTIQDLIRWLVYGFAVPIHDKNIRKALCSLTHCILVDSSTVICWMSPLVILGVLSLFCHFHSIFLWKILLAYNVDPDQMPHYVASDLGLHCLPLTLLRVS